MALNPSSKRKPGNNSNTITGAARKRAKTFDARSLAVQAADAALSASGELDVAAYVAAREFEIRSLESGMQRSKLALTSRAFQKVPRSLRRRTASHNVKRVPRRLRGRARREMLEDNTPTVTARTRKPTERMRIRLETARRLQNLNSKSKAKRAAAKAAQDKQSRQTLEASGSHAFEIAPRVPKIKKNRLSRPPPPDSKFRKRQRCKTWLPTHMFHAKRARMATSRDPVWRFALPITPTEKSYRPTHRARGTRGAVAWDASYMATVGLEGGVEGLEGPIAPVMLVWCAEAKDGDVEMGDADATAGKKGKRKVLVRVHPSAFLQVWNELLGAAKRQNPPVMVEDLRFEIGSIEMTGPGSTEALISALKPVTAADGSAFAANSPEATWKSLLGVSNASSLPQNAILAFSVSDPRLQFPPTTLKPPTSETQMQDLAILLSAWAPDTTQTASALFDRRARLAAARQLPSQKAINRRRTEAGPGIPPPAKDTDPQIPVMVLACRSSIKATNGNNAPGSWTVLLPWKCLLPFWYSLMYYPLSSGGNPRFGGLKEQQQLAFEAGEPWFPGDFPGTRAGWEWGLREREQAKQEWERRPKGRRVEFDSIDLRNGQKGEIGRGWACDWERLIQGPAEKSDANSKAQQSEDAKPKDGNGDDSSDTQQPPLNIHQLPSLQAARALNNPPTTPINPASLATVKLSLHNRGTPTPRARIYRLPTTDPELRQKWLSLKSTTPTPPPSSQKPQTPAVTAEDARQRLAASLITPPADADARQDHLPLPSEADLIGFVTTGNYNLSEGRGTGIGSIQVSKVVGMGKGKGKTAAAGGGKNVCIIRGAGETVGRLGFWELV
ncbi:putative ribonuclease P complex subunit Pop1 [Aspergillus heteromorphus CBS 117.55]|uniref:Putative ribonuclease P complex subunit Pop1 n=1 Tax=Aspergillus heteromorphus CBS 117.55 TaxID=1448321 RepID=A0A317WAF7_9EURO|nr:putative ribonuclease P complex subunit Pop1 [Aspergillus heteromorphus CBS 117.55]PWY83506.1 putative ribonuclease P complex subunit Pop1 [Aspergillus heteromorphus CBS 117.55]